MVVIFVELVEAFHRNNRAKAPPVLSQCEIIFMVISAVSKKDCCFVKAVCGVNFGEEKIQRNKQFHWSGGFAK